MDIAVPLIFILVLVVASFSLFLVFKFGIKKKSYEEALAEHRKQTSALLGTKQKPKEKKNKKATKKINKEKPTSAHNAENEILDDNESVDSKDVPEKKASQQGKNPVQKGKSSPKQQAKVHVEFKEETEEVPVEIPVEKEVKEVINKKRVKKVRPILVKKTQGPENVQPATLEVPIVNHFDVIHPKDEFELLHSNSKEDINKTEQHKEEKKPERTSKKNKQPKQEAVEKAAVLPPAEPQPVEKEKPKEDKIVNAVISPNHEPVANSGKEKKKKKSEFNTKQQLTAERDHLIYAVRNAELSRTEVQLLIDLLLNKQLEAPAVIDEWSEGKSDPVQKLKKQLAEKEKLLADEQEVLVGVQAKLKEVRSEQLAERAQLQQKMRASEEAKTELIARLNGLQQKLQEMNDVRNKELSQLQILIDDNNTLQMQRDRALMSCQESDALVHTLKTDNANLSNELQRLQQELQDQIANYQGCLLQIQPLQEDLRLTKEYAMGLERDHSFAVAGLVEEKRAFAENAHKEEQRLQEIIGQLKLDNVQLQEERNIQVNGSTEDNKAHEVKLLNLTNELTSVNQQFQDAERHYQTELKSSSDTCANLELELEEQKSKNNELRKKNWKVMEALNAAESRNKPAPSKSPEVDIDKLSAEIRNKEENAQKEFLQRLFPKLEDLKAVSLDDWHPEYERLIKDHISSLENKPPVTVSSADQTEEVTKLKTEILRYKSIIDDTDGTLRNLQSNIEREEKNWRTQLAEKDAEIQELRNKQLSQLQSRVSSLEGQLEDERIEKQRLLEEKQQVIGKPEPKTIHADSTATIEKLSEEVYRLKEQLRVEQTKNGDADVYQNGKSS